MRNHDPDFQVSANSGHVCIVFSEDIDNGNHIAFDDLGKANLFASSILEIIEYLKNKKAVTL